MRAAVTVQFLREEKETFYFIVRQRGYAYAVFFQKI